MKKKLINEQNLYQLNELLTAKWHLTIAVYYVLIKGFNLKLAMTGAKARPYTGTFKDHGDSTQCVWLRRLYAQASERAAVMMAARVIPVEFVLASYLPPCLGHSEG